MTPSVRRARQPFGGAAPEADVPVDAEDLARLLLRKAAAARDPEAALVGDAVIAAAARAPEGAWRALAGAAEFHRVTPLLAPVVAACADARPAPPAFSHVRRTFAVLAARHRRAALARERCIDRLLTALSDAGIPVVLLKGAALAHLLYGEPALRAMADVDVLVDPRDGARAADVARQLGYAFERPPTSRFASRRHHHLPVATTTEDGFAVALEIHTDALALEHRERMPFSTVAASARTFSRGSGPDGRALGHVDMLRHLSRHTFGPARRVRLIHLYDLWRYPAVHRDEIDWGALRARFPHVTVAIELAAQVFSPRRTRVASGVGRGMIPLSEIAACERGARRKLAALLNPPPWWMHGFYGVPPERSLLLCRTVRHPATLARWMSTRLASRLSAPVAAAR